jgi:hypothetical protein
LRRAARGRQEADVMAKEIAALGERSSEVIIEPHMLLIDVLRDALD